MITLVEIKGPQSSKGLKHPLPWNHLVLPSAPGRQCWVAVLCHAVGSTIIQEEEGLRVRICCQVARTPCWIFWERRTRASSGIWEDSEGEADPWGGFRNIQAQPGAPAGSLGQAMKVNVKLLQLLSSGQERKTVQFGQRNADPSVGSAVRGNELAPSFCSHHACVPVLSLQYNFIWSCVSQAGNYFQKIPIFLRGVCLSGSISGTAMEWGFLVYADLLPQ